MITRLETPATPRLAASEMNVVIKSAPRRYVMHCCERHQGGDRREQKRKEQAQASWDALYSEQGVIPCHYWHYKRDATSIGDPRPLPFLKDVLEHAMRQASSDDLIVWTNDDVWLHPELPGLLRFHVALHGCCSAQRLDFPGPIFRSEPVSPQALEKVGQRHIGRDLFAFEKRWLEDRWNEIPDSILGASDFDLHLACMIRVEKGNAPTRANIGEIVPPCELPLGYVIHAVHEPAWRQKHNVDKAPSQIWNRNLFAQWGRKHAPSLVFHPGNII